MKKLIITSAAVTAILAVGLGLNVSAFASLPASAPADCISGTILSTNKSDTPEQHPIEFDYNPALSSIKLPSPPDTTKMLILYEGVGGWIPGSEWCVSPTTQTLYYTNPIYMPWQGKRQNINAKTPLWIEYAKK